MRKTYLDNIRWITIVLVIVYHVIYMFNGVTSYPVFGPFSDNQPQDIFQYVVYPWFMLLLFTVSGMCSRYELERRSTKEFVRLRTRKYLVPSTLGLLAGGFILGYYNVLIGGGLSDVLTLPKPIVFMIFCFSGTGPLWYIQMLWIFSVLLVAIRKIEKDKLYNLCSKAGIVVTILFTVVICGAAYVFNLPIVVYRFGIYGAGFFFGYFVMSHDDVMEKMEKNWLWVDIMAIAAGIVYILMNLGKSYTDIEILERPECSIYAWLATVGIILFMKKWGNFENSFTKWMITKSWGLYVFHYLPMAVASLYLLRFVPNVLPFAAYLVAAVSGFAGAIILYEIISRIPVWRWFLLGIRGEKK